MRQRFLGIPEHWLTALVDRTGRNDGWMIIEDLRLRLFCGRPNRTIGNRGIRFPEIVAVPEIGEIGEIVSISASLQNEESLGVV